MNKLKLSYYADGLANVATSEMPLTASAPPGPPCTATWLPSATPSTAAIVPPYVVVIAVQAAATVIVPVATA